MDPRMSRWQKMLGISYPVSPVVTRKEAMDNGLLLWTKYIGIQETKYARLFAVTWDADYLGRDVPDIQELMLLKDPAMKKS